MKLAQQWSLCVKRHHMMVEHHKTQLV